MTVNSTPDCDLISSFLDLGPLGKKSPIHLKIPHGLHPGSMIFLTARCENQMQIGIKDDANNTVQNMEIRVNKNDITIKDQQISDIKPNLENEHFKARFALTCVCEPEGYRIFINGKQVEFFKRTYTNNLILLSITDCHVYKIMYTTIIFDTKKNNGSEDRPSVSVNNNDKNNNEGNNEGSGEKEEPGNLQPNGNKNNGDKEEEKEKESSVDLPPPE